MQCLHQLKGWQPTMAVDNRTVSGDEANLVKDWGGRLVAKAGGSKGHALHNSSGGEGHPVGDISHRPDVVHSRPGVWVYLDGLVLI